MSYYYHTNCVSSTAAKIGPMVDSGREITGRTFRKRVGKEVVEEVFAHIYDEVPRLSIWNDYHVSFWKSNYCGKPCYYLVHSGIEHVFLEM